ncbi:endonuclease domain-containing protein [Faunimonas sp. B44]|uniref:endonuclease domain-containing protein n=1 Tax=Faunimonas sp. B44 TaxID=3461493 RepID=UPI00404457FA
MPRTDIDPQVRGRARTLRKGSTLGEKATQAHLRGFRQYGAHFRREAPNGPYVVDFAWLSARIVIEIDGASHDLAGRAERDAVRDRFLSAEGFHVIRVRDSEVLAGSAAAFATIEDALRPYLKSPSPNPSPRGGGGRERRRRNRLQENGPDVS